MTSKEIFWVTLGSYMAIVVILPFLYPIIGAFIGWMVGLTGIGNWIVVGAHALGLTTLSVENLWAIGAFLGFISLWLNPAKIGANNNG